MESTATTATASLSSEFGVLQKLPPKTEEIYAIMLKTICCIETSKGKATGICLGERLIGVPFSILDLKRIQKLEGAREEHQIGKIGCVYKGVVYGAFPLPISLQTYQDFNFALYKVDNSDFDSIPRLPIEEVVGSKQEVYFGGFPLKHGDPTFHTGSILSVFKEGSKSFFTIEGTIDAGNLGGPIFGLNGDRLSLIGIISSQMADVCSEDQKKTSLMDVFKATKGGYQKIDTKEIVKALCAKQLIDIM